jgi:hypothetical protein
MSALSIAGGCAFVNHYQWHSLGRGWQLLDANLILSNVAELTMPHV